VKTAIGLLVLVLAAACGGSSTQQLAQPPASVGNPAVPTPVVTQAPLTGASVGPLVSDAPQHSPDPVSSAEPAGAQAMPGAAYASPATTSGPPASPSPRRTPTPVAGTVTVTDNDSGSTVHLVVGQHLRVRLSQGTWDPPDSSNPASVTRRSNSGGYPSDQPVDALFDAVAHGQADVTAQSDAACFHTQPRCLMATRQWQVSVVVG
jgi:hypothetical protein